LSELLLKNKVFLSCYLVFLVVAGAMLIFMPKGDEILFFNSLHKPVLNNVFVWITHLAEWPIVVFILLVAIFSSFGRGLAMAITMGLLSIPLNIAKKILFSDVARPSVFFQDKVQLDFIPGLMILHYNSFPSGHTAAGFAMFFLVNIFVGDGKWGVVTFTIALLIGISRMYLLQHFLIDVFFGSIIGVSFSLMLYLLITNSKLYNSLSWKDKRLLNNE
jgi:membrane-associated phospholipid phosphatase